jgi:hypothetical protein
VPASQTFWQFAKKSPQSFARCCQVGHPGCIGASRQADNRHSHILWLARFWSQQQAHWTGVLTACVFVFYIRLSSQSSQPASSRPTPGGNARYTKILSLSRQYGKLDGQIAYLYATAFQKIYSTLTTEQSKALTDMRVMPAGEPSGPFLYANEAPGLVPGNSNFLFSK